jgi:hypothetical protein
MASKVINPNTNHQNLLDLATASGQAQDILETLFNQVSPQVDAALKQWKCLGKHQLSS